jgi:hypothetical protein
MFSNGSILFFPGYNLDVMTHRPDNWSLEDAFLLGLLNLKEKNVCERERMYCKCEMGSHASTNLPFGTLF